jgi:hypothetical protein
MRCHKWIGIAAVSWAAASASASAGTLRVVEYNVNADTTDANGFNNASATTVETVLQAIGLHQLAGHAQPIDVLALTELQGVSNSTISPTLATVTADLNAVYGAGTYAYNATVDPTDGPTYTGNGPSGLVYDTKTIASVTGTVVATDSSGSDPRSPMRYQIQPANATAASQFYLYVDHYKANRSTAYAATRANESVLVRQNGDTLGANANVIYTGDFNLAGGTDSTTTSGSAEQAYKNLTAAAGATLYNGSGGAIATKAGAGQAVDPLNPSRTFTNDSSTYTNLFTESATDLTARFDMQLVSNSVSTGSAGLQLVADTQTAFGNSYYDGSTLTTDTAYGGTVNTSTNTALFDLPNASTVLSDLTQLTDHLPIVADYDFTSTPEPTTLLTTAMAMAGVLLPARRHRRR